MKSSIWILIAGSFVLCDLNVEAQEREPSSVVPPFLRQYCLDCHQGPTAKADLDLTVLVDSPSRGEDLEQWSVILRKLERSEMPPSDAEQPEASERHNMTEWIDDQLRKRADHVRAQNRVAAARRLTNIEYENTIRDLLGIELNLLNQLPKDPEVPYRFNNTADFMRLGPEQIDRYLECARRALASAIVDAEPPEVHKFRREWQPHGVQRGLGGDEIAIWGNGRGTPGKGMGVNQFPTRGEFRVRLQASGILPPGFSQVPLRVVMGFNLDINSSTQQMEPVGTVQLRNSPDEPLVIEFRGRMENIPIQTGVVHRGKRRPDSIVITPQNLYDDGTLNDENLFLQWPRRLAMPRVVVNWMEFEAPVIDVWPPEHHTRILFDSSLRDSDPDAYTREVLRRFMTRAYRRPATDEEVVRFEKIHAIIAPQSASFEDAMRETLAMVLVSPQFLFHTVEQDGIASAQYALASRLSYFLWGSMPDEELLQLAASERLDDAAVLEEQVLRLLSDPRSSQGFRSFCMQWLSLGKMKTVPINKDLFPRFLYYVPKGERAGTEEPYRPTIRDYMLSETIGFTRQLFLRNQPVDGLVDSDFAWLNQPLAAHYGIAGVDGNDFRAVMLKPGDHLGGLLTHGSVLIGNGTGTAPHPIYRAVWLREAILGDEVPAPPADVPALSDSAGDSAEKALTIKTLLEKHRHKESCNDCHARLDPWGIPFEHYNAIGRFQPRVPAENTRVRGFDRNVHKDKPGYLKYLESLNTTDVDASSRLPGGPEVNGIDELKRFLLKHRRDDIAENVMRRLMGYGIGRELDWTDRYVVKELMAKSRRQDHRLRDMLVLICQSPAFRSPQAPVSSESGK